jgi:hypothetical protein
MRILTAMAVAMIAGTASAQTVTIDFEDLSEGFYGANFVHQGIEYSDINQVSGEFPSGETFGPQAFDEFVIEDATLFYNDYPTWGTADKMLTFGSAFVPGDNLSLGRVSSVTMTLDDDADSVSMDIGFYEDGPWGGIVLHIDTLFDGNVVGSDTRTLTNNGGRDSTNIDTFSVSGATFDEIHVYATYGAEFSLPRLVIDDITLNYVGADCLADVNGDGSVTPTDFTAWINAFNNNLPECDQNGDGNCTSTDFTAWITNFNAGC